MSINTLFNSNLGSEVGEGSRGFERSCPSNDSENESIVDPAATNNGSDEDDDELDEELVAINGSDNINHRNKAARTGIASLPTSQATTPTTAKFPKIDELVENEKYRDVSECALYLLFACFIYTYSLTKQYSRFIYTDFTILFSDFNSYQSSVSNYVFIQ